MAVLSPRPLPRRFFHSARFATRPARTVCSSHSRRIAGEVADLGWVDHADDVTRIIQRQGYAETVTTGRLHADVGLFAAHGFQPGQHSLPAIGTIVEDPGLLPLTSRTVCVQGLLGHVDSNYRVTHVLLP